MGNDRNACRSLLALLRVLEVAHDPARWIQTGVGVFRRSAATRNFAGWRDEALARFGSAAMAVCRGRQCRWAGILVRWLCR